MKKIRIDKQLSTLGYGSRKDVEKLINLKLIRENNKTLINPSTIVCPNSVYLNNEKIKYLYPIKIAINKPTGFTCSRYGEDSIFNLLPEIWLKRRPKVNTVGRLDKDSSGLLIVTDDGEFLHRIISPINKVPKVYIVKLLNELSGDEKDIFEAGTMIISKDKKPCKPIKFIKIDNRTVELTLFEGKYHQIKKMFLKLKNKVIELERIKVGNLQLNKMRIGSWKKLTKSDIENIFKK